MDDISIIIDRVKKELGVLKDNQLADIFELTPQEFSRRKKRETLLLTILDWAICHSADLNWLLTGKKASSDSQVSACDNDGKPLHSIIIERFNQKDLSRDISYELLKLEEKDPNALKEVIDFIRFKLSTIQSDNNPDRRKGQRRQGNDNYSGEERRSGTDRREAVGE